MHGPDALVEAGVHLRQALLNIIFRAFERHGKLLQSTAVGFFKHSRVIAAGLFILRLGIVDALAHGLRDANGLRRPIFELLLNVGILIRSVVLIIGLELFMV